MNWRERVQTSLKIRNGKSWIHESEEGCWGSLKLQEGRPMCPRRGRCLPSPLSTPHHSHGAGHADLGPAGRTEASGRSALRAAVAGCRPRAARHSPAAPCPARGHSRRASAVKRTPSRGSGDPRSLARSRHGVRALRSPALPAPALPHPPLLNFNGRHPGSPRSARRGQSSPSPQPRANRSARRLPRPHPALPPPPPSCSPRPPRQATKPHFRHHFFPHPPPPSAGGARRFRSAPGRRSQRQE